MRHALIVLLLAVLAGCAPVPSTTPDMSVGSVVQPKPADVVELTTPPSSPATSAPSCDATASLRPSGPLPAPGAMPAGSTMEKIQSRGRLIAGVDQNSYLLGFRNPSTGQIEGFDIDIARQVAKAILGDPTKIQFTVLTSDQRIPALQQQEVDIVVRTMTINCERAQKVDFSSVYYQAGQRVLVPRGAGVTGIDALGGKRVCATKGSSSLNNVAAAASKPIPVAVPNWTDCLVMLQQGQVDAISTDDTILAGLAAQDPYTEMVGEKFTQEPYGMAVHKGNEDFVRFVNAVLEQIRGDGTWASIHQAWLGRLGEAPTPPPARYRD